MYYLCKFTDTWTIYDKELKTSRILDPHEVVGVRSLLSRLLASTGMLLAIQIAPATPNKLAALDAATPDRAYYVTKAYNIWTLIDGEKGSARLLDDKEVNCLKGILSRVMTQRLSFLVLQFLTINPSKLVNLPTCEAREKSVVAAS